MRKRFLFYKMLDDTKCRFQPTYLPRISIWHIAIASRARS